jgi:hypothetical protein
MIVDKIWKLTNTVLLPVRVGLTPRSSHTHWQPLSRIMCVPIPPCHGLSVTMKWNFSSTYFVLLSNMDQEIDMFTLNFDRKNKYCQSCTSPINIGYWVQPNLETLPFLFVYYETRKRELHKRLIHECRCDERLKPKAEGSTRLGYTGLRGTEHLKI